MFKSSILQYQDQGTAEERLWRAVITKTLEEWMCGPLSFSRKAEQFLFDDKKDFKAVCSSAGMDPDTLEKAAHDHSRPRHPKRKYSLPCAHSKAAKLFRNRPVGANERSGFNVLLLAANRFRNCSGKFFLQRHQSNANESRDADRVADFASLDALDGIPERHARDLQQFGFIRLRGRFGKIPGQKHRARSSDTLLERSMPRISFQHSAARPHSSRSSRCADSRARDANAPRRLREFPNCKRRSGNRYCPTRMTLPFSSMGTTPVARFLK